MYPNESEPKYSRNQVSGQNQSLIVQPPAPVKLEMSSCHLATDRHVTTHERKSEAALKHLAFSSCDRGDFQHTNWMRHEHLDHNSVKVLSLLEETERTGTPQNAHHEPASPDAAPKPNNSRIHPLHAPTPLPHHDAHLHGGLPRAPPPLPSRHRITSSTAIQQRLSPFFRLSILHLDPPRRPTPQRNRQTLHSRPRHHRDHSRHHLLPQDIHNRIGPGPPGPRNPDSAGPGRRRG